MAEHTINTRIKIRQDTASNWETKNPSLLDGEICYDTTTRRFKIGIGNANWNDLPFVDKSSTIETLSVIPADDPQYLVWVRSEKDGFSYLFKRDDVFIDKDGNLHDIRGKLASESDISSGVIIRRWS